MSEGFANAIIGGAETLVRSAIRSVNYVAGLAGWRIGKDGTAEFNSATIRGTLIAGGGNVTVDSDGLHVVTVGSLLDVDRTLGLEARNNPDNGSIARLDVITSVSPQGHYSGAVILGTDTPSNPNGNTMGHGYLAAFYNTFAAKDIIYMQLSAPRINALYQASLQLRSQSSTSAVDDTECNIDAKVITNRFISVVNFGTPSIANNTVQALTPTSIDVDPWSMASTASPIITITSGFSGGRTSSPCNTFNIGCTLRFATNATGVRMARILLNGVELTSFVIPTIAGFNTTAQVEVTHPLVPGDQIQFAGYQTSGAALSLTGGANKGWVKQELG